MQNEFSTLEIDVEEDPTQKLNDEGAAGWAIACCYQRVDVEHDDRGYVSSKQVVNVFVLSRPALDVQSSPRGGQE